MGQLMKKDGYVYIRDGAHDWKKLGKFDSESKILLIVADKDKDTVHIPFSVVKRGWFNAVSVAVNGSTYQIPISKLRTHTKLIISNILGEEPSFVIPKSELQKWKNE